MKRRMRLALFWTAIAASFVATMTASYMLGRAPGVLMGAGVWAGVCGVIAVMVED